MGEKDLGRKEWVGSHPSAECLGSEYLRLAEEVEDINAVESIDSDNMQPHLNQDRYAAFG